MPRLARKPIKQAEPPMPASVARGYARYLKIALQFPGMEQSTSYGTPAIKCAGKFISRWRTEAEGALAIRCDFLDREILLQAQPEVFFLTDHYKNYPAILVRLDKVRQDALADLVTRAWRASASKKILKEWDSQQTNRPAQSSGGSSVRTKK